MRKPVIALALALSFSFPAEAAQAAEFFMISRHVDGVFYASHRIYTEKARGLYNVEFCGRRYWTRPRTIAWMRWEVEHGRRVTLEFDQGSGWRRACLNPQEQVSLQDIGIEEDYVVVMRLDDGEIEYQQRFRELKKAFNRYGNSGEQSSTYHAK
ncbi:hypothetical protein GR183_18775 [Stappia sp. GBMRC 2046]|uniref:Uncharacterized protein n=1 Tax=Stappia sediminis TaxID=2692190 RepID=A0A7X3S9L1_9HYPH|nr:hypothetical protein [Stappia sediminis]MXN66962.1 hypothetical protein [Stappia sediminis]